MSGIAFLSDNQAYYEISDSMDPVIAKGSLLFVKEKEDYDKGDIVAFSAWYGEESICVTHRIVDKLPDGGYITKGDANRSEDQGRVDRDSILGKVTGYVPFYGYVCAYIKKNTLLIILILAVSLYVFFK